MTNGASAAARSPGLGAWEKTGPRSIKGTSLAYLFNATNVWTGTQKMAIAADTQDDAPQLTGVVSVDVFNTSGALIATNCATAVGQRATGLIAITRGRGPCRGRGYPSDIGFASAGIGRATKKRRHGFAIRRAHRLARLTRALSVAMPVFAYI